MSTIELRGLQGLKGLNYRETKRWYDKKRSINPEKFDKLSDDNIRYLFLRENFEKTFGDDEGFVSPDIAKIFNSGIEEASAYWNAYQDYKEDPYTGYSVETPLGSRFDEKLPYDDKGVITPMSEIFKQRLSDEDKELVNNTNFPYQNDFESTEYVNSPTKLYDEKQYKEDPAYYYQVDNYAKEFKAKFDNSARDTYDAFTKFDIIADGVSPIYKNMKNSDRLGLDANTIKHLMSNYYAISNLSGENEANEFLKEYMQNRLAERQSLGEKFWEGFKGVGTSAYGALMSFAGAVDAIVTLDAFDKEDNNPNLSGWSNFWNEVIDNDLTRYGQDVIKYGTYKEDEIKKLKASGLDGSRIFQSVKEQQGTLKDMVISENFLPTMLSQHGFTIATSLISFGSTAALKGIAWLGKTLKNGAKALKTAKNTTQAMKAAAEVKKASDKLDKIKKVAEVFGDVFKGFGAGALAGTGEAVTNALDSKDKLKESGEADINKKQQEWINSQLSSYMEDVDKAILQDSYVSLNGDGKPKSKEELEEIRRILKESKIAQLEAQYAPIKEAQLEQLELETIQAQNTNFAFNQVINGAINGTLKATIMHPSIQKTLGKYFKSNALEIAADGKWYKVGWHYAKHMGKEAFGEGLEEYSTELSDAFSRGWHGADFEHYLENGYHKVGTEAIDAPFGAAMMGGLKALGLSAFSKEAAYAFISGAFSSGLSVGNVSTVVDTYNTIKDPNSTTSDIIRSVASNFIRSSVFEGWHTAHRELAEAKSQYNELSKLSSNPNNARLHTNAVTLATFASEAEASVNSELDYRNSMLGKAVSEINLLEKTKTTHPIYYAKTMQTLAELQELDENTEFGKSQIEEYRNAGLAEVDATDAEIAAQIRKNTEEFINLRKKVIAKREAIERKYSHITDFDVLDALTFGDITEEEYSSRIKTMTDEIHQSYQAGLEGSTTSENGSLSTKEKQHYINYGDSDAATKSLEKLNSEIEILEAEKLDAKRKSSSKNKEERLKNKRIYKIKSEELKAKEEARKQLKKSISKNQSSDEVDRQYLSEQEILALSSEDRAKVMSDDFYKKASKKQQDIIDNLKKILQKGDNIMSSKSENPISGDSLVKIKDVGTLDKSIKLHEKLRAEGEEAISQYGKTIKYNALKRKSEDRIKGLKGMTSYEEFEKIIVPLFNSEDIATAAMDKRNAETILKDDANYIRFKEKTSNINLIFDKINKLLKSSKFTKSEAEAIYTMGGYLAKSEIKITDIQAIEAVLTPENLDNYYKELLKEKADPNVTFSLELIRDFIDYLKDVRQQVRQAEEIKKPIEVNPNPNKDVPVTPVIPTEPEISKEEKASLILENMSLAKSIDKSESDFIEDYIKECVKNGNNLQDSKVLNPLVASLVYSEGVEKQIANTILTLMFYRNFNKPSIREIKDMIESKNINVSDTEIEMVYLKLTDPRVEFKDGKTIVNYQDVTEKAEKLINEKIKKYQTKKQEKQPSKTSITIPVGSDNPDIRAAEEKHGVLKYLENNPNHHKDTEIIAVVATDIPNLITDTKCPIYLLAVNRKNGTIKIGSTKYQVIAVLSPSDNLEGSEIASTLQRMAIEQGLHKEKGFIPIKKQKKSGEGYDSKAFVRFESFTTRNEHPTHMDKSKKNKSIRLEIEGGKKTIRELLQKLVSVKTTVKGSKTTVVYTSPFTGKEVENIRDAKEGETDREYIAYINKKGNGEETEIEIFVEDLDKYETPIGKTFIDILKDLSISVKDKLSILRNSKKAGYFVSSYVNKFITSINKEIESLKNVKSKEGLDIAIARVQGNLDNLLTSLNRYIYTKKASLKIIPLLEDGKGSTVYGIGFFVNGQLVGDPINIGEFKKTGPILAFKPEDNIEEKVLNCITSSILDDKKEKLREHDGFPIFKFQVDYDKVDSAKKGFEARDKKDRNEELTEEEKYLSNSLTDVEEAIQDDMLTHSKEEGLDRKDWTITITKRVDSFMVGGKVKKENISPTEDIDAEDLVLGEVLKVTPVVNPTVKQTLDKLVEAKKERDIQRKQKTSEGKVETATSRNYQYEEDINPVVEAVGNIYDKAVRDLINGDVSTIKQLTEKYPNLKQEEASNLFNNVKFIIDAAANEGWTLDAREMYLDTTLPSKNNDEEVVFHGIPDIVGYNANGELIIIDIKTFHKDTAKDLNSDVKSWGGQTSDYGNALTKLTGYPVKSVYIFPIQVDYNRESSLNEGVLKDGIADASITSKVRTLSSNILLEVPYSKLEHSYNPLEESLSDLVGSEVLGVSDSDMLELLEMLESNFVTAEEEQKDACKKH